MVTSAPRTHSTAATPAVVGQNLACLEQATLLLGGLDDDAFSTPSDASRGATAGAHLRHCLDFYRSFLQGLATGRVDYDARARDPRLETDREVALDALVDVAGRLGELGPEDAGRPLDVRLDAARDDDDGWSRSSVGRELQFLLSHTVHHFALVAMVLRGLGVEPAATFGVAPSTLQYRAS